MYQCLQVESPLTQLLWPYQRTGAVGRTMQSLLLIRALSWVEAILYRNTQKDGMKLEPLAGRPAAIYSKPTGGHENCGLDMSRP